MGTTEYAAQKKKDRIKLCKQLMDIRFGNIKGKSDQEIVYILQDVILNYYQLCYIYLKYSNEYRLMNNYAYLKVYKGHIKNFHFLDKYMPVSELTAKLCGGEDIRWNSHELLNCVHRTVLTKFFLNDGKVIKPSATLSEVNNFLLYHTLNDLNNVFINRIEIEKAGNSQTKFEVSKSDSKVYTTTKILVDLIGGYSSGSNNYSNSSRVKNIYDSASSVGMGWSNDGLLENLLTLNHDEGKKEDEPNDLDLLIIETQVNSLVTYENYPIISSNFSYSEIAIALEHVYVYFNRIGKYDRGNINSGLSDAPIRYLTRLSSGIKKAPGVHHKIQSEPGGIKEWLALTEKVLNLIGNSLKIGRIAKSSDVFNTFFGFLRFDNILSPITESFYLSAISEMPLLIETQEARLSNQGSISNSCEQIGEDLVGWYLSDDISNTTSMIAYYYMVESMEKSLVAVSELFSHKSTEVGINLDNKVLARKAQWVLDNEDYVREFKRLTYVPNDLTLPPINITNIPISIEDLGKFRTHILDTLNLVRVRTT
jgi:hypothetical protein